MATVLEVVGMWLGVEGGQIGSHFRVLTTRYPPLSLCESS